EILLTISINGRKLATTICSPWDYESMAVGFLASENIVTSAQEIAAIEVDEGQSHVNIAIPNLENDMKEFPDEGLFESLCGKSRQANYGANRKTQSFDSYEDPKIEPARIMELMNDLMTTSEAFQKTGGVHRGFLVKDGEILLQQEDVSRNNVLDRILGECILKDINRDDKVLIFSGRVSSEVILKVAHMGVPILVSHSAPLQRALEVADERGITVAGFTRGNNFNVYTHPKRIVHS
ncbi:MAG: formate dehydrogenase accessory sulfurtransferase FdhD, partial [Eggerthellaceae bacterium]|nr:formate dehydrogenase accessory sulfurtransferase FdhD [Eggerthellaceae bacterium]